MALHEDFGVRVEQIGACTLYLADCMDVLPTLPKVDAVVTDPPYGNSDTHTAHLSKVKLRNGKPARQALTFTGFSPQQTANLATQLVDLANRWVVMTCEWKHAHLLDAAGILVRLGIWRKRDGAPQFTGDRPGMGWEAVAICHAPGKKRWNGGGKHAFWDYPKHGVTEHPTEKPLLLVKAWVKDFTDEGETILDPFMGSGTTGVACVTMGRRFIGIERERKYFEIACKRISEARRQSDLFVALPAEQVAMDL